MMKTIELWPRPVFGPTSTNRFGKPATVVPRWPCMPVSAHTSPSERPSRPRTQSRYGMSVTRKPVPHTIASAGGSTPSAVPTPAGGVRSAAARGAPGRRDALDRAGHERRVRLLERGEVLVAHQDPLAADLVARRELLAQGGIVDLLG